MKDTILTGASGIALNQLSSDTLTHFVSEVHQSVSGTPVATWTNLLIAACTLAGIIIQTFFKKSNNSNNQNNQNQN